jgi:hypothetical protein
MVVRGCSQADDGATGNQDPPIDAFRLLGERSGRLEPHGVRNRERLVRRASIDSTVMNTMSASPMFSRSCTLNSPAA